MKQIKFSHDYYKLPAPYANVVRLLQVMRVDPKTLSKSFVEYDTEYPPGKQFYELPASECILLFFMAHRNQLFTTIRRYTPEKWDYYSKSVGEDFTLVISKDKEMGAGK